MGGEVGLAVTVGLSVTGDIGFEDDFSVGIGVDDLSITAVEMAISRGTSFTESFSVPPESVPQAVKITEAKIMKLNLLNIDIDHFPIIPIIIHPSDAYI